MKIEQTNTSTTNYNGKKLDKTQRLLKRNTPLIMQADSVLKSITELKTDGYISNPDHLFLQGLGELDIRANALAKLKRNLNRCGSHSLFSQGDDKHEYVGVQSCKDPSCQYCQTDRTKKARKSLKHFLSENKNLIRLEKVVDENIVLSDSSFKRLGSLTKYKVGKLLKKEIQKLTELQSKYPAKHSSFAVKLKEFERLKELNNQEKITEDYTLIFYNKCLYKKTKFLLYWTIELVKCYDYKIVTKAQLQKYKMVSEGVYMQNKAKAKSQWKVISRNVHYGLRHLVLTVPHIDNGFRGETFYFQSIINAFKALREKPFWDKFVFGGIWAMEFTNANLEYNLSNGQTVDKKQYYELMDELKEWESAKQNKNSIKVIDETRQRKSDNFWVAKPKIVSKQYKNINGEYKADLHIHLHVLLLVDNNIKQSRNKLYKKIFRAWNSLTIDETNPKTDWTEERKSSIMKYAGFTEDELNEINPAGSTIIRLESVYKKDAKGKYYANDSEQVIRAALELLKYFTEPFCFDKAVNDFDMQMILTIIPQFFKLRKMATIGCLHNEPTLSASFDDGIESIGNEFSETIEASDKEQYLKEYEKEVQLRKELSLQHKVLNKHQLLSIPVNSVCYDFHIPDQVGSPLKSGITTKEAIKEMCTISLKDDRKHREDFKKTHKELVATYQTSSVYSEAGVSLNNEGYTDLWLSKDKFKLLRSIGVHYSTPMQYFCSLHNNTKLKAYYKDFCKRTLFSLSESDFFKSYLDKLCHLVIKDYHLDECPDESIHVTIEDIDYFFENDFKGWLQAFVTGIAPDYSTCESLHIEGQTWSEIELCIYPELYFTATELFEYPIKNRFEKATIDLLHQFAHAIRNKYSPRKKKNGDYSQAHDHEFLMVLKALVNRYTDIRQEEEPEETVDTKVYDVNSFVVYDEDYQRWLLNSNEFNALQRDASEHKVEIPVLHPLRGKTAKIKRQLNIV